MAARKLALAWEELNKYEWGTVLGDELSHGQTFKNTIFFNKVIN